AHYITNMRTAAVSASAVRLLAKPDARTLAIIGAGHLAQSHLAALRRVRDFDDVRVWSPKSAASFAERNGVTLADSTRDAVQGADVVVAATSSTTPVLEGDWLESDCLVCTVGAPRPDWRELDDVTIARADGRVVVDSRQAALAESGDVKAGGRVYAELGEIICGKAAPLTSERGIVIFKSLGMAVQDIVTAQLAYKKLAQ
ncbi:ornithine cyclodeaminase family protein, partial [Pseudorhodoplanes sp.]|uniref:ornithine cyclodeaminase family protein n=1 Tax=Pseudorhodoplanes sp. TaxID=1934341 RepID=UPI003D0B12CE